VALSFRFRQIKKGKNIQKPYKPLNHQGFGQSAQRPKSGATQKGVIFSKPYLYFFV
jgi:hypothetical protein